MLFTISKPHRVHGEKIEDRISQDYISFLGLAKQEDYFQVFPGFYQLRGNCEEIQNNVFMPENNKQSYLVRTSDANKTLPTPISFQGELYEPIIGKIWLPDSQILEDVLETLSTSAYLRKVNKDSSNLIQRDFRVQRFDLWTSNYNSTILEEQLRREEFKRKAIDYEKGIKTLENSSFTEWFY